MSVLADASAIVAILTREDGSDKLGDELGRHDDRFCCGIGVWEAVRAVARKRRVSVFEAQVAIEDTLAKLEIALVPIGATEWRLAVEAHDRYGKGTGHPARLNMGDCFAYACAKANHAKLLYKGDDFAHTDLA